MPENPTTFEMPLVDLDLDQDLNLDLNQEFIQDSQNQTRAAQIISKINEITLEEIDEVTDDLRNLEDNIKKVEQLSLQVETADNIFSRIPNSTNTETYAVPEPSKNKGGVLEIIKTEENFADPIDAMLPGPMDLSFLRELTSDVNADYAIGQLELDELEGSGLAMPE